MEIKVLFSKLALRLIYVQLHTYIQKRNVLKLLGR